MLRRLPWLAPPLPGIRLAPSPGAPALALFFASTATSPAGHPICPPDAPRRRRAGAAGGPAARAGPSIRPPWSALLDRTATVGRTLDYQSVVGKRSVPETVMNGGGRPGAPPRPGDREPRQIGVRGDFDGCVVVARYFLTPPAAHRISDGSDRRGGRTTPHLVKPGDETRTGGTFVTRYSAV